MPSAGLKGIDAVCHLAAVAGVGQSMYQIAEYTTINNLGTAVLLEQLNENSKGAFMGTSAFGRTKSIHRS